MNHIGKRTCKKLKWNFHCFLLFDKFSQNCNNNECKVASFQFVHKEEIVVIHHLERGRGRGWLSYPRCMTLIHAILNGK